MPIDDECKKLICFKEQISGSIINYRDLGVVHYI